MNDIKPALDVALVRAGNEKKSKQRYGDLARICNCSETMVRLVSKGQRTNSFIRNKLVKFCKQYAPEDLARCLQEDTPPNYATQTSSVAATAPKTEQEGAQ